MVSMNSLPVELQEQVFACLLPHLDRKQLAVLPVSSNKEREDVYNIRLTCRKFRAVASKRIQKDLARRLNEVLRREHSELSSAR
jgi:hypothetical protein